MEKRRSDRINENLDAELIADGVKYPGIIMNFSNAGLYMVTATAKSIVDISVSTDVELKCTLPDGKALNMECQVKWFQTKSSPHGVSFKMGMEIKSPPKEYEEFVKSA